jgi:hypothetical protein
MKTQIQLTVVFVSILFMCRLAQAEIVDTVLTFDSDVAASWTPVDFNNDGINDISFNFYGLTPLGDSATFFLDVVGDGNSQVLVQGNSVLPLDSGTIISQTPIVGSWVDASSGPNVWTQLGSSGQVVGVGAPDSSDYMGVRFAVGSDWYYGWIRFGPIPNQPSDLPPLSWPSVLEFAYETSPDTPIVVPEPNILSLFAISFLVFVTRRFFEWRNQNFDLKNYGTT